MFVRPCMCSVWGAGTWAVFSLITVLLGWLLLAACRHLGALSDAERARAALETAALFAVFWGPHLADESFHIHHYFYSWTVRAASALLFLLGLMTPY